MSNFASWFLTPFLALRPPLVPLVPKPEMHKNTNAMISTFRVVFYLRSNYVRKDGKSPIRTRVYLNNDRMEFDSTGLAIDASLWDVKEGRPKKKAKGGDVLVINAELNRIESDLLHIYRRFEFSENLSLDLIKSEFCGKKEGDSFLDFFDDFLAKVEAEVGKVRSKESWQKFNVLKKHFVAYLQTRCHRKDLLMNELTYRHISEFEHYLLTDGKCKHNTVMRMMGNFKTLTIRAMKLGLLKQDPYLNYKIHFNKTDRGFLTDEEIKKMMRKKFTLHRLEVVRDIFIFSCFTGLAYIDVAQLTEANIVTLDGNQWIMTKRQKTNVPSNVLLLDVPKRIIAKYHGVDPDGRLLPILTNQRMNSYLKEIADVCGIDKNLTFHIARHTFATLALSKGVPVESLSKMLGHTKITTTQIYARITNKKIEGDMKKLSGKLGDFDASEL